VTPAFGTSPFVLEAALLGALGGLFIIAALAALRRARPLRFALRTLAGLLLLSLGALAGAIGVGLSGYRALTREEVAARIDKTSERICPWPTTSIFRVAGRNCHDADRRDGPQREGTSRSHPPLQAESLALQIEALARNAERSGGRVDLAPMFVQGDLDHFALDSRERRHQLVVERDGELEAVR